MTNDTAGKEQDIVSPWVRIQLALALRKALGLNCKDAPAVCGGTRKGASCQTTPAAQCGATRRNWAVSKWFLACRCTTLTRHLRNFTSPTCVNAEAPRDVIASTESPLALEFGMATESRSGVGFHVHCGDKKKYLFHHLWSPGVGSIVGMTRGIYNVLTF